MLTKKKVISSINEMPEKFSVDEVIDRILLLEKIEKGLNDVKKGKVTSDKDLNKKLGKWLG